MLDLGFIERRSRRRERDAVLPTTINGVTFEIINIHEVIELESM
jgi:hypothetical protein